MLDSAALPVPLHASPEMHAGACTFRPRGPSTLVEAVDFVAECVAYCRRRALGRLMIVCTGLEGVPVPSLVDRFLAVEEWARAASGMVAVVLVVHEYIIHPEKFGVKVAADFGLTCEVFADEGAAAEWLEQFP